MSQRWIAVKFFLIMFFHSAHSQLNKTLENIATCTSCFECQQR